MKFTDIIKEHQETKDLIESDANLEAIAKAVKGTKGLFSMDKPLKKAGFKTTPMGYSFLKVQKGKDSYMIGSVKNADAGDGDIIQDGYVIGKWS